MHLKHDLTELNGIYKLETLAANAWPAKETLRIGGWLLRADNGITRRANSVLPLDSPAMDVDLAISKAIDFYQARKIIPRFQMTQACSPPELDFLLQEGGFSVGLSVYIQTNSLDNITVSKAKHAVRLDAAPQDDWIAAYGRLGGFNGLSLETRHGIMNRIAQHKAFASVSMDGEIVGVCLGVAELSWLGLFALVVDEDYRRIGIGADLNRGLAEWAKGVGASNAYLQVETRNALALDFHRSLGFSTSYKYWYRVLNGE
ncbi:MAG: GNAT family N-acetyltransferase [Candidatus Thorarchaeota archaeon]|nr:GNAT family N-acetyltransferase [Candidatus Thorarchaeota archaeon]